MNHQKYGFEVDIFSLGGVLYMMLVGEDPPQQGIVFDAPKMRDVSPEAKDLLRRMVKEPSEERITLDGIRDHAFVKLHYGVHDDVPAQLSRGNSRERKVSKNSDLHGQFIKCKVEMNKFIFTTKQQSSLIICNISIAANSLKHECTTHA